MKLKKEEIIILSALIILFFVGLFFDKSIILKFGDFGGRAVDDFFIWVSYAGTWFVVLFLMTTLFLWNERKRRWIFPLWLSLGITEGIVQILKILFDRMRPYELFEMGPLVNVIGSSFPSGHAAAVFSSLAVLDKEFKRFKWLWLVVAFLVAFSRVYLEVHYLSDVAVGALAGYLIGIFIVRYWDKKRE